MRVRWVFKDIASGDVKRRIRDYFNKKQHRIEKHLSRYPEDLRRLQVTVHYVGRPPERWEVRFVLQLPTGTLVADETRPGPEEAMDVALDELLRELRRHRELLRKDYTYRRRRQERAAFSTAAPLLERDVQSQRRAAFFDLLKPIIGVVRDHARRELDVLELEGLIPQGELSADDLVDDVLVRAWRLFPDRPTQVPLDLWLIELLHERFDALQHDFDRTTMSSQIEVADEHEDVLVDQDDPTEYEFWLERLFDEHVSDSFDELIPDESLHDVLDDLDGEERAERIKRAVAKLPPRQRRTLLLYATEGYDADEIAMAQNRPVAEVESDIAAARQTIVEQLSPANR